MMSMRWGFFSWPVLFVIPMIAMAVFMIVRRSQYRGPMGPGCEFVAPLAPSTVPVAALLLEDSVVTLRERFARGEIDLPEFEARLEGLLLSDPNESIPWQDLPATAASSRTNR